MLDDDARVLKGCKKLEDRQMIALVFHYINPNAPALAQKMFVSLTPKIRSPNLITDTYIYQNICTS